MSSADDVKRAARCLGAVITGVVLPGEAVAVADLIATIRAETFETCAAHLEMRAGQSMPDLVGRISADVLRAGASEIRMLAREAAKEPR